MENEQTLKNVPQRSRRLLGYRWLGDTLMFSSLGRLRNTKTSAIPQLSPWGHREHVQRTRVYLNYSHDDGAIRSICREPECLTEKEMPSPSIANGLSVALVLFVS